MGTSKGRPDTEGRNGTVIGLAVIVVALTMLSIYSLYLARYLEANVGMVVSDRWDEPSLQHKLVTWCEVTNFGPANRSTINAYVVFKGRYGENRVEDTRHLTLGEGRVIAMSFGFDIPEDTDGYTYGFEVTDYVEEPPLVVPEPGPVAPMPPLPVPPDWESHIVNGTITVLPHP
jgi:hypothetical protein